MPLSHIKVHIEADPVQSSNSLKRRVETVRVVHAGRRKATSPQYLAGGHLRDGRKNILQERIIMLLRQRDLAASRAKASPEEAGLAYKGDHVARVSAAARHRLALGAD